MIELIKTLLDLGHSTSQNLEFSYSSSGSISYGEETITETNLLELRRRNPRLVRIETFSKIKESLITGADWDWHIIDKMWTQKMRIQAKRVTKDGSIKGIHRQARTATDTQIRLLIDSSKRDGLMPTYCFYCAKAHRKKWVTAQTSSGNQFETGCLLARAQTVQRIDPGNILKIEKFTFPWHHLFPSAVLNSIISSKERKHELEYENPESNGVSKTENGAMDAKIDRSYYEKRQISALVLMDVGKLE